MKIYLDLLFFLNFLVCFIILCLIQTLFCEKIFYSKVTLSSTISGLMVVFSLFSYPIYLLFKFLGGFFLVFFGGGKDKFIIKCGLFYLFMFAFCGIMSSFKIESYEIIYAIILLIILVVVQSFKKMGIFVNNFKYTISVQFEDKEFLLTGFLDTGNFSSYEECPIIYLDRKYFVGKLESVACINIKTVSNDTIQFLYKPKNFRIKLGKRFVEKEVYICFCDLDEFECLLNYKLIM